jgi:hypothetical protein
MVMVAVVVDVHQPVGRRQPVGTTPCMGPPLQEHGQGCTVALLVLSTDNGTRVYRVAGRG